MPKEDIHNKIKLLVEEANASGIYKFGVDASIKNGTKVLVLRRKKGDALPGMYVIPGGAVEDGETLEHALEREVTEETGLHVKNILEYLLYFDIELNGTGKIRIFVFSVDADIIEVKLTEHDDYKWISRDQPDTLPTTKEMRIVLESILVV